MKISPARQQSKPISPPPILNERASERPPREFHLPATALLTGDYCVRESDKSTRRGAKFLRPLPSKGFVSGEMPGPGENLYTLRGTSFVEPSALVIKQQIPHCAKSYCLTSDFIEREKENAVPQNVKSLRDKKTNRRKLACYTKHYNIDLQHNIIHMKTLL